MTKELKALEKFLNDYLNLYEKLHTNQQEKMLLDKNSPYNVLKTYLEFIENAKPSEVLKDLKELHELAYGNEKTSWRIDDVRTSLHIKQYILKAQEQEKVIIELCEYYGLDNLYPYDDLEEIEYALKNARDMSSQQRMELLGKLNKQEKENAKYKRVLDIIKEKGFDKSIKDYNDYAIWLEYKIEQFDKAIKSNPTILNWGVFDLITYNKEEFDLLKAYFEKNIQK